MNESSVNLEANLSFKGFAAYINHINYRQNPCITKSMHYVYWYIQTRYPKLIDGNILCTMINVHARG